MKKLVLFDGMAMVYRSYYALNGSGRMNSKGLNTSAVLGFTNTLYDLLKKLKPTHVAVAFDVPKPTFRHEMYTEYKANREAMPEAIQVGLPYIRSILQAFRIPVLTCEGFSTCTASAVWVAPTRLWAWRRFATSSACRRPLR